MNKNLLILLVLFGLGLASCKKCADCACVNTYAYTFGPNVSESTKEQVKNGVENTLDAEYPENTEEICERGKKYDESTDEFEDESASEHFENPGGGSEYSYEFNHTCTCEEK